MPKLAERVRRLVSPADSKAEETIVQISLLEERLDGYGLRAKSLENDVAYPPHPPGSVYLSVGFETTISNRVKADLGACMKGHLKMEGKQWKPQLQFDNVFAIVAGLYCDGVEVTVLNIGDRNPYEEDFLPCHNMIKSSWTPIHSLLPKVDFKVFPENGSFTVPERHTLKVYSLDETVKMKKFDPKILAVHQAVGTDFFYGMVESYVPLQDPHDSCRDGLGITHTHYLMLKLPGVSGQERAKAGVDAFCRVIDSYRGLRC